MDDDRGRSPARDDDAPQHSGGGGQDNGYDGGY
jgi:hypothetical protein